MAVFSILHSRRTGENAAEFVVCIREGELRVGDVFRCFDTHHPFPYTITAVEELHKGTKLSCSGLLGCDDFFAGATVDTSFTKKPHAFRYDGGLTTGCSGRS